MFVRIIGIIFIEEQKTVPRNGLYVMLDDSKAQDTYIGDLIESDWIDYLTRTVYFELNLYNGDSEIYTHAVLRVDYSTTGNIYAKLTVSTLEY